VPPAFQEWSEAMTILMAMADGKLTEDRML
jgi:hypothetical protein